MNSNLTKFFWSVSLTTALCLFIRFLFHANATTLHIGTKIFRFLGFRERDAESTEKCDLGERFSVGDRPLTLDAKLGMIPSLFTPEIWYGDRNRSQKYVIEV